jgi:hypothetical protein
MDLPALMAAVDTVHARDPSTLRRIDASTARVVPAAALDASSSCFQTHTTYAVDDTDDASAAATLIHIFTLRDDVREALVRALVPLGLRKFRRGREDEERSLGGAVPGPGSDVSVVRSNRGGYQSYADLLDSSDDDDDDDGDGGDDDDGETGGDAASDGRERTPTDANASESATTTPSTSTHARASIPLHEPVTWTTINAIAIEAYECIHRPAQRPAAAPADVYGWLNVNAPGDYNRLHAHDSAEHWSGVLYLQIPHPVDDDAGCLGVRSAAPRDARETPYFVHPPRVGDLACFSGAALHAVSAFTAANAQNEHSQSPRDDAFRVSVAFNIE